jgi:hypothetical protein
MALTRRRIEREAPCKQAADCVDSRLWLSPSRTAIYRIPIRQTIMEGSMAKKAKKAKKAAKRRKKR